MTVTGAGGSEEDEEVEEGGAGVDPDLPAGEDLRAEAGAGVVEGKVARTVPRVNLGSVPRIN